MTLNTAEKELANKIFELKRRKVEIEKTNVMFRKSGENEELVKIDLELSILDEKHYIEPEVKPKEMLANNE